MLDEISDIGASVWISASAGTGKTKSLIDRILALLLNGVTPKKILCLTYTKAAATEMLTRLMKLFQQIPELNDEDLKSKLNELRFTGTETEFKNLAQKLYQKSLISSEWVQIKTIHSFCFGILQRFPLETGLMPGVTICSDYERSRLLQEAFDAVIFREDCREFSKFLAHSTIDISNILKGHLLQLQKFLAKFDDFTEIYGDLFCIERDKRNLLLKETQEARDTRLIDEVFKGKASEIFKSLSENLSGIKRDKAKVEQILLNNAQHPSGDFWEAFFTKDFKPRAGLNEKMQEGLVLAQEFLRKKSQYTSAEANIALFSLLRKIIEEFSERKRRKHCIDYDDIISMTSSLLNNLDWVMFRIDNSIDHLLVDEAQDTSPEQWEIINQITDEFFSNYGSQRTVFVVGDEKQSIYSFQGADIQIFQKMHDIFEARSLACGQRFHNVQLRKSYRTSGNILRFVDNVFENTYLKTQHSTNRTENAGVVDIVDLFDDDNGNDDSDLIDENDNAAATNLSESQEATISADRKLAEHIATFIKDTIDSGHFVESRGRQPKPEDFMILFQKRDLNPMEEIIKALQARDIPVSGLDRFSIKDEVVIEDLITFAQFAVFPLDDLLYARVLRSPIVGISEEDLMHLCLERAEKTLWEYCLEKFSLDSKSPSESEIAKNLMELKVLIDEALHTSAYIFFSNTLTKTMKEKFIQRLGEESLDSLGDFMDIVANYEKENTPSLQSFLEWFSDFGEKIEIKKDAFAVSDCVRLMTVHASKGLQAPFVLLADTHFYNDKNENILKTDDGILVCDARTKKEYRNCCASDKVTNNRFEEEDSVMKLFSESKKACAQESLRRMYVALTRAEDYVGIFGKKQKREANQEQSWYKILSERKPA